MIKIINDEGILFIDVLPKGVTINGAYYANLLDKLPEIFKQKRKSKKFSKMKLLHDNARPHTSKLTTEKLQQLNLEQVSHPPYSPDPAPSDYFLFKNLKIFLQGKKFMSKEEVESAVLGFFDAKTKEFYREGFDKLLSKWKLCIESKGEYFAQK